MKKYCVTKVVVLVLLCAFGIVGCGSFHNVQILGFCVSGNCGCGGHDQYERTVELSGLDAGPRLVAETSRGSITVTGADVDDCSVTATIKVWAETQREAENIAEKVKVIPKRDSNGLTLVIKKPILLPNQCIGVDLNVIVPRQIDLNCASSRGSLEVSNINGDIKGTTSRGSISVKSVDGSVQLNTSRGSITCENVSGGDCRLQTSRGSISVSDSTVDSLHLESSRGNIDVSQCSAATARIVVSRGHTTCTQIAIADLKSNSSRGNIKIVYSASSPNEVSADLTSSRGDVDIVMPSEFAGFIDLSTSRGSVNTDLPITVRGQISDEHIRGSIGQGNGSLQVKTSRGSVRIK